MVLPACASYWWCLAGYADLSWGSDGRLCTIFSHFLVTIKQNISLKFPPIIPESASPHLSWWPHDLHQASCIAATPGGGEMGNGDGSSMMVSQFCGGHNLWVWPAAGRLRSSGEVRERFLLIFLCSKQMKCMLQARVLLWHLAKIQSLYSGPFKVARTEDVGINSISIISLNVHINTKLQHQGQIIF